MRRFLNLDRNVFYLGLVSLFTDLSTEMIYPILPLFLSVTLGVDKAFIGVIEGVAESSAAILKFFSGYISDRVKRRRLLVGIGYTLSAVTKPLFALSGSGGHVLAIRLSDRVGKGIRTAPRDALIADSEAPERMGRAFGFHRAMDTVGAILGPLATFLCLLILRCGYRPLFLLSVIPAAISVLIVVFLVRERRQPRACTSSERRRVAPGREFTVFLVIVGIFALGNSSDAFLILRAESVGVSLVAIPLLWMCLSIVHATTSIPCGILSDRIGRKRTIVGALAVYSLVYFGLASASRPLHIWVLFGAYGLYYGLSEGVMRAFVADVVGVESRGTAYGLFHTVTGLSAFPASVLMGLLWQFRGPRIAFSLGGLLALIAALLLCVLVRKGGRRESC